MKRPAGIPSKTLKNYFGIVIGLLGPGFVTLIVMHFVSFFETFTCGIIWDGTLRRTHGLTYNNNNRN